MHITLLISDRIASHFIDETSKLNTSEPSVPSSKLPVLDDNPCRSPKHLIRLLLPNQVRTTFPSPHFPFSTSSFLTFSPFTATLTALTTAFLYRKMHFLDYRVYVLFGWADPALPPYGNSSRLKLDFRTWPDFSPEYYWLSYEMFDTMPVDPFEVRMRFTQQLQHLSASVTSSKKAAQYALKHRDLDEDLHSCILEQLEKVWSMFKNMDD